MLEAYGHGGDLLTASELYGVPPEAFLDFSANLNPFGPPQIVGKLLQTHWRQAAAYPDPASRRLRQTIAAHYHIPPESIWIGNGAAELIELAVRLSEPQRTVIFQPAFVEYEQAVRKIGGAVNDVLLRPEDGFMLDEAAALAAFADADAMFLGNPNNPTGRLVSPQLMKQLAEIASYDHKTLLIDEAFLDFIDDERQHSMMRQAAEQKGLFVIRSMTKFFAVPGLRLGFIVAHPETITALAQLQTPWSVNFFAQLVGEALLAEHTYIQRTKQWLAEERPWFHKALMDLGLQVVPGEVNFVLFALPEAVGMTVSELQRKLGKRGILIRDASHFKGLDASYGRLAIKQREHNLQLLQSLKDVLNGD